VCVVLIWSRVSSARQLILTYQFVFIWLFLTTYWLQKKKGISTEAHWAQEVAGQQETTQWPYYIIIMIMLILLQLIPTPFMYVLSSWNPLLFSYLLAFLFAVVSFCRHCSIWFPVLLLLLTVLKIICKRISKNRLIELTGMAICPNEFCCDSYWFISLSTLTLAECGSVGACVCVCVCVCQFNSHSDRHALLMWQCVVPGGVYLMRLWLSVAQCLQMSCQLIVCRRHFHSISMSSVPVDFQFCCQKQMPQSLLLVLATFRARTSRNMRMPRILLSFSRLWNELQAGHLCFALNWLA